MNTKQIVDMLLNKENEVSSKFHCAVIEILRIGYETERGRDEIFRLIDSIKYSLEDIERIINR